MGIKQKFRASFHNQYFKILKSTFNLLKTHKSLKVPFILTCAAALEYYLNDLIIDYADNYWTLEDHRDIASALISIHFKKKLNFIVPLLSNNKYMINQTHYTYKRLSDLIQRRNSLIHNKPEIADLEMALLDKKEGTKRIVVDAKTWDKLTKNAPDIIKYSICTNYYKALEDFIKRIYNVRYGSEKNGYKFTESKLIIKNKKGQKIKT